MMFTEPGPGGSRTVQAHSPELPRVWENIQVVNESSIQLPGVFQVLGRGKTDTWQRFALRVLKVFQNHKRKYLTLAVGTK